tara:strand:- start:1226 stop:2494 length:1269 start_codon:yes stop_codon:yes gene_type:complete
MLEIKVFRESPEKIFEDLKKRNLSEKIASDVIDLDNQWRNLIEKGNRLRAKRNAISKNIGELKKKGQEFSEILKDMARLKEDLNLNEKETEEALRLRDSKRMVVPNLLDNKVPIGKDEEENVELSVYGTKKEREKWLSHQDILEKIGGADLKRAAKITGRRFYFMTGDLARLELALINFAVELLCQKGYHLATPPFLMNREAYEGVVDLSDFEDVMYKIDKHDLYLIATSEHPLTARFKNEIIELKEGALKYAGISTNFRREVGAHGISDRGIWRVHQFSKVEQVIICKPEDSKKMHKEILNNAIEIFEKLEIPFRVIDICTGDIGTVAARKFDIEAWMPSTNKWKEVVSASNCKSYQSVRLNMRYRTKEGTAFPHTLNSTAVATTRALAAIIENNQTDNGDVIIPKVLRKWMGNQKIIESK